MAVPQFASAAILFGGFYNFDGTDPESAEATLSNFTVQVDKSTASSSTGGSTDSFYGFNVTGPISWTPPSLGPPVVIGDLGDGYLNLTSAPTVFSIYNGTLATYTMTQLCYDLVSTVSGSKADVKWKYLLGDQTVHSVATSLSPANASPLADYADFESGFPGVLSILIAIPAGETVLFSYTQNGPTEGLRLDNIAFLGETGDLTAVPEPGSLVALGCLVGSGAFLRSRRRNVRL